MKSFMSYLKPQVSFSLNFGSFFNIMRDNSSVLFWLEFYKIFRKNLTVQVKFHQICILIGTFCWKYTKFQLKKYRRVMSHDTEDWCKIWRKNNLSFQKWQEFGKLWSEHSKVSKICTLISRFRAKYITFDLKK